MPGQISFCRVFCYLTYQLYHVGQLRAIYRDQQKTQQYQDSATNHTANR